MEKLKKLKLAICCVLIAIIVLSASVCTGFFVVQNTSADSANWNDYACAELTYIPSKNCYEISTPEQLACFNKNLFNYSKSTIVLTANISMAEHKWFPNQESFQGIFDGQNYTISNLSTQNNATYGGLFSKITNGGKVRNLNINNSSTQTKIYSGIIAGSIEGPNSNISNCNIINSTAKIDSSETATKDATLYSGCIVGYSYLATINNCFVFNSKVDGMSFEPKISYAGGIVGKADNTVINTCAYINSNIKVDASQACHVGGIVGMLNYKGSKTTTTVKNCYTEGGYFRAGYYSTNQASYCGGIVGSVFYGNVSNCFNGATIYSETITNNKTLTTNVVNNSGNMYIDTSSHSSYSLESHKLTTSLQNCYIGGIVGYHNNGTVSNCYNKGKLSTQRTGNNRYTYTPAYNSSETLEIKFKIYTTWKGIQNVDTDTITYNYNTLRNVGVTCGYTYNSSQITNCYSKDGCLPEITQNLQMTSYLHNGEDKLETYKNGYTLFRNNKNGMAYKIYESNGNYFNNYKGIDFSFYIEVDNTSSSNNIAEIYVENIINYNNNISNLTSQSEWAIIDGVNDGDPIITSFYWIYNTKKPQ